MNAKIGKGEGHDDENSAEVDRKQRAGADESRSSLLDGDDSMDRIYGAKGGGGERGNDGEGDDAEGDGDSGSGSDNDDAEGVNSNNIRDLLFYRPPSQLCALCLLLL
jgi:hypothetical protein